MKGALNPILQAMKASWKPQDLRTPWEWCEDHVVVDNTSPFPGKWRAATSPWVKELMEVSADRRVRFIAVRCSAQSSKTQTVLNLLCYDIAEDAGPEMYVMANQEDAEDFVRDRFRPTLMNCAPAKDLLIGEGRARFTFSTMPLYFVGAGSLGKLQGKPMKKLRLDEVRNWPKGALPTVMKRVRAFSLLGSQILLISTPDMKNDEVDAAFMQGDQRAFHFPCPACGQMQQLRLAQLKWNTNDETKPNGQYNFDKLAPTVRLECENPQCKHEMRDTPAERKLICRTGHFIRMNPNAPAHHVSFTWNALLPWWVPWRAIVEEFLLARISARNGDIEPMKTFVNETLGEPWEDRLGVIEDFGFLEARKAPYEFGEVWAEEQIRFMAADKQERGGEHYWWVIRAFGLNGASRLVAHGKCNTKAELEEIRKQYGVLAPNAMMDSGFSAQEVYRFCVGTGWKIFKGDHAEYYLKQKLMPGGSTKTFRSIWRRTNVAIYNRTTRARVATAKLFMFCNDPTKDLQAEYMTGLIGNWTIPEKVERDYLKQLTAERREEKADGKGRISYFWKQLSPDNHYLDCELMILVAAIVTKRIAGKSFQKGSAASSDIKPQP